MASTSLTYTQETPTTAEARKFTFSAWVKKCKNAAHQGLYGNTYDSTHRGYIYFDNNDKLGFWDSTGTNILTNRQFRDNSAWYHIVFACDTTQATASDRVKVYVNGVLQSLQQADYPTQDYANLKIQGTTNTPYMGKYVEGAVTNFFDGCLSHVHWTQGYTYQASDFGETDSNGVWKIKTSVSITYGTNGFFILKDGNSLTDQSSNSNNWTLAAGTLTDMVDNPSNNFATFNPLNQTTSNNFVLSKGNTTTLTSGDASAMYFGGSSTIGASSGKFYCEMKTDTATSSVHSGFGISYNTAEDARLNEHMGQQAWSYGIDPNGNKHNNGSSSSYGNAWTEANVIGMAFDLDNHKIYWSIDGVWQNSGDPTSGSTGTGSAFDLTTGETYFVTTSDFNSSTKATINLNFGNGYFGTTAISSEGTNASGIGKFEYNVPTGYTALCTKGLNE